MKRIRIIALLATLTLSLTAAGQSSSTAARVNRIKADTGYFFGEGTMSTQQEAIDLARNILRTKIEAWRKEQPEPVPDTEELLAGSEQILLMRGTMHRAFVYTKKPGGQTPAAQAPASEPEPTTTAPAPQPETPAEPAAEAPAPQPEQPAREPEAATPEPPQPVWSFPYDRLFACRNISEVIDLCNDAEVKTHIVRGNVTRDSDPNEVGVSLLVVYATSDNSVRTVLAPKNEIGNRINLRTKQPDSTRNYPGCQAMWIKILK